MPSLLCLFYFTASAFAADPQLHLTLSSSADELVVTWHAVNTSLSHPALQYSTSGAWSPSIPAFATNSFANDECPSTIRFSASASLPLPAGATCQYRVTSDGGATWSPPYTATNPARGFPLTVALWGDLGVDCGGVLPPSPGFAGGQCTAAGQLALDAESGAHHLSIHFGDSGYNMDDKCGTVGDHFMAVTSSCELFSWGRPPPEPSLHSLARSSLNHTNPTHTTDTARRPHVYTNGNHEGSGQWKPYTEFTQRLAFGQGKLANASQSTSVRWSAWETGPVAWIALDPDAYIYPLVYNLLDAQYAWLKAALQRVNRTRTPWLVFLVHRAAYCTKSTDGECNSEAETLRKGQLGVRAPLETLLQQYGVDFYFSGHTHHYERTWPVLAGAATAQHYVNPRATIHIQSGIAGTGPGDMFVVPQEPWEAFRDELYVPSYGRLVFHNESAATYYVRFVCFCAPSIPHREKCSPP